MWNKIEQQRINALVAIYLHKKRLKPLKSRNQFIELLSIAVPAFYITPRLIAKGTPVANLVNVTGEVLAAILLVLAILKIVKKWQDEEILTIAMMRRNADVAREADRLLQSSSVNREAAN
jgi:mobilome CxxCx(11)CxxC protein